MNQRDHLFRVGVIGPRDSVSRVLELGQEFGDVEFVPGVYSDYDEIALIVVTLSGVTEVLLFTGPVPYHWALQHTSPGVPLHHVPFTSAALLSSLFKLMAFDKVDLCQVSIDGLDRATVEESYRELGLKPANVHVRALPGGKGEPPDGAFNFHLRLWEAGKTSGCLSVMESVHRRLRGLSIPSERVRPPMATIRETIQRALLSAEGAFEKASQVAICLFDVDGFRELAKAKESEYAIGRLKLKLHRMLLDYGETLQASIFYSGGDRFHMVTTRGVLQRQTDNFRLSLIQGRIKGQLGLTVSSGIGLGRSAREAEEHAKVALQSAKSKGKGLCYVLTDEAVLIGPLSKEITTESAMRSHDPDVVAVAGATGLSVYSLSRLRGLLAASGSPFMTANELARALSVSRRTARRLLSRLKAGGLAKTVGHEAPGPRGRPRMIYMLNFPKGL